VIVVVTEVVALTTRDARAAIAQVAKKHDKPVVACLLGASTVSVSYGVSLVGELPSPERAAAALNHVCRYAEWRLNDSSSSDDVGQLADDTKVRAIVASRLESNPEGAGSNSRTRRHYSKPVACRCWPLEPRTVPKRPSRSPRKLVSRRAEGTFRFTRSQIGRRGCCPGTRECRSCPRSVCAMSNRLGEAHGWSRAPTNDANWVEAIIGIAVDPDFGPVVMAGLGGVMTDLLGDHAFAVPPFNPGTAEAMVRSLRAAPLLDGYRGSAKVDRDALISVLESIAKVAEFVPELVELDLNPVVVTASGALVVDCKARLAPGRNGQVRCFARCAQRLEADQFGRRFTRCHVPYARRWRS